MKKLTIRYIRYALALLANVGFGSSLNWDADVPAQTSNCLKTEYSKIGRWIEPSASPLLLTYRHVILSEAKNLYDCPRDPSLSLRVTYLKSIKVHKVNHKGNIFLILAMH